MKMQPEQRNVYQSGLPLFVLRTVRIIQTDSLCNLQLEADILTKCM
jgi:hypothetical protein